MGRNLIQIILEFVDKASRPLKSTSKAIEDVGAQSKTSSAAGVDFKGILTKIGVVAGVAGSAMIAFKKAMDMGREGAQAIQTGESFEFLMDKIGATPELLDELKKASKGTVSELDLMRGVTTLVAGAQGELAKGLANASPELLAIAKAASKLNPQLGDTAYMYDSLGLGIKRASPMILDNLGLTIKLGQANETLAKALGKTVEELTAEEQKQALLNEVLRAGNVLIEQAGGNTDSATDSFDRLSVATSELKEEMGKKLAPVMANIAEALTDIISGEEDLQAALKDTTGTYDEYVKSLDEYVVSSGYGIQSTADAQFANEMYTEAVYNSLKSVDDLNLAHEDFRLTGLSPTIDLLGETEEATDDLSAANVILDEKLKFLHETIKGPIGEAYDTFVEKSQALIDKGEAGKQKLEELTAKHEESTARIIFGYYEQELARDGLTETELAALTEIGKELGIYDEKTAAVMQSVAESVRTFNESGEMDQILGDVRDLNAELNNIPKKITIDIETRISQITLPTGDVVGQKPEVRAGGGPVYPRMPYIVGESGPELFVPTTAGTIVPNSEATNNNFYMTANYTNAQSESTLAADVRMLSLLYG